MIKVSCEACGAGFSAKDELAGRHGKCPSCKAPIVVPELETDADDAEEDDEAPVPVASSRRRSSGGSRRGRSSRPARTPRKKDYRALGAIIVVVAVVGGIGVYYAMQESGGTSPYSIGIDLMADGLFDEAIAEFDKIEPDSRLFAQAAEQRQSAVERRDAGNAAAATRKSENTYALIVSLEKHHVARGGKGHLDPNYAPNTRYMLKRCAQFKKDYPTSSHIAEIDAIMWRYSDVASLDTPPTEADTRAEMTMRMIMQNPNYKDALLAVDEFATAWPDEVEAAREMRNEIQAHSREYWALVRADLEGYMQPGEENWQHVANECASYLKKIAEADGLVAASEARELQKRATDG